MRNEPTKPKLKPLNYRPPAKADEDEDLTDALFGDVEPRPSTTGSTPLVRGNGKEVSASLRAADDDDKPGWLPRLSSKHEDG